MSELFRSLVLNRRSISASSPIFHPSLSLVLQNLEFFRFDNATLRVLESALVSKDVKSSMEVRSGFRQFMKSESLSILRETAEKNVEEKLLVLEFLVCAFALVGDVESCLALRYEALLLRDVKSSTNPWLEVSYTEWLNFAHQSIDSRFYSVAGKACEHALDCIRRKSTEDRKTDEVNVMKKSTEEPKTDDVFESVQAIEKIKRLKDCAMASASSHSVQAQTADYLKKRLEEKSTERPLDFKEPKCVASTLFRNGIRRRNLRKLNTSRSLLGMTNES